MKRLTTLLIVISLTLFSVITICAIDNELFSGVYKSELTIDYSTPQDEITHGATGFLYGLAEPDIPDGNMLYAISPKVLATRVPNGLQHPSGDLARVSGYFFENGGENIIIYMQDIYPDWYYSYREDYLDTMSNVIDTITPLEHSDKFIYQPLNEMNNGVWYGDFSSYTNRVKFYNAFKDAYNLIKEKTNGAPVGGPAYTDYNSELIKEFLSYCIENDCVPDVMIWHELYWYSTYGIRDTVKDYRKIEKELGLDEIRIIIDEYGTFKDIGTPGNMLQYLASFEETNTDGCLAFWRLPNNMNDLCASNNMPTSAWWLYHWYSQMQGTTYQVTKSDKTIPYFSAITTSDSENITIICGGGEGKSKIELSEITSLEIFNNAKSIIYEIEYLDFEGLTAPSLGGTKLLKGKSTILSNSSVIKLGKISTSRAYKIKVYPSSETIYANSVEEYEHPIRYEGENATYSNARIRTYDDIRYASSGGGIEVQRGGNVSFNVKAEKDGLYALELAYLSNPTIGNVRLNSRVKVSIDGKDEIHNLPNTLTSHSSSEYVINTYFTKGEHNVTFKYDFGVFTIDFMDVKYLSSGYEDYPNSYICEQLKNKDENIYMIVVPQSGYYSYPNNVEINSVNGISIQSNLGRVYLEYGINLFVVEGTNEDFIVSKTNNNDSIIYSIEFADNSSGYLVENDLSPTGYYLKDVPSNYPIDFNVYVEKDGYYALTTLYSQIQTEGNHAYNVKLVERYSSIMINGTDIDTIYFANTYSNFNFKEKTIYVYLSKGSNQITFINKGDYVWNNLKPKLPNIASLIISPIQ